MNEYTMTPEEEEMLSTMIDRSQDMVNHPPHYTQGEIECIDAMIAARGHEAVAIYCELAAFKYIWRCGLKDDPKQEISKAKWYINKAAEIRNG